MNLPFLQKPFWSRYWFFWAWMVLVNAVLAYSSLSLEVKLWIFVVGWLFPTLWFLTQNGSLPSEDTSPQGIQLSFGVVWFVMPIALFLRTVWFGDLPNWPLYDEAVNGYFAMKLDQHWTWHLFFFWSQLPPILIWIMAGGFKIIPSTLAVIRFLPLLFSLLMLPLAYSAARLFFDRTIALLYLTLVSTGFGFLYFGRICHQGLLLLLWEFVGLYTLGQVLKTTSKKYRSVWLIGHGLVVGIGFYTYFAWPVVAVVLTLPVLWALVKTEGFREKRDQAFLFFVPLFLILTPMALGYLKGKFGTYYSFMLDMNQKSDFWGHLGRIGESLSGSLWGSSLPEFYYAPVWGGFLNPILGSFLVIGLLFLPSKTGKSFARWFTISLFILFVPNIVSGPPFSEMRVVQCLPFLAFLTTVGFEGLLSSLPRNRALWIGLLLLGLSSGLDLYHLARTREYFNHYWNFQKTKEFYKAFPILEKTAQEDGPGIVLTGMDVSVFHDRSLRVACYPFNIKDNAALKDQTAHWVGIVTNVHYKPFLEKDFQVGQWYALTDDESRAKNDFSGGQMLAILPITKKNRPRIEDWTSMDEKFEGIYDQVADLSLENGRDESIRLMNELGTKLSQDRWVRSCYWDINFYLNNWQKLYGAGEPSAANFIAAQEAIVHALQEGYPAAHFYNELGSFYYLTGNIPEAEKNFRKAMAAPLNLTPAADNLALVEKLKLVGPTPGN